MYFTVTVNALVASLLLHLAIETSLSVATLLLIVHVLTVCQKRLTVTVTARTIYPEMGRSGDGSILPRTHMPRAASIVAPQLYNCTLQKICLR
jgi:hypothetical protein